MTFKKTIALILSIIFVPIAMINIISFIQADNVNSGILPVEFITKDLPEITYQGEKDSCGPFAVTDTIRIQALQKGYGFEEPDVDQMIEDARNLEDNVFGTSQYSNTFNDLLWWFTMAEPFNVNINGYKTLAAPKDCEGEERSKAIEAIQQEIYKNGTCLAGINLNDAYHSCNLVGWNDKDETFYIRNTYGKGWGENGYMWIPYDSIQAVFSIDVMGKTNYNYRTYAGCGPNIILPNNTKGYCEFVADGLVKVDNVAFFVPETSNYKVEIGTDINKLTEISSGTYEGKGIATIEFRQKFFENESYIIAITLNNENYGNYVVSEKEIDGYVSKPTASGKSFLINSNGNIEESEYDISLAVAECEMSA